MKPKKKLDSSGSKVEKASSKSYNKSLAAARKQSSARNSPNSRPVQQTNLLSMQDDLTTPVMQSVTGVVGNPTQFNSSIQPASDPAFHTYLTASAVLGTDYYQHMSSFSAEPHDSYGYQFAPEQSFDFINPSSVENFTLQPNSFQPSQEYSWELPCGSEMAGNFNAQVNWNPSSFGEYAGSSYMVPPLTYDHSSPEEEIEQSFGSQELIGMGLYDHNDKPAPPVSGKGLVLEKEFQPPTNLMDDDQYGEDIIAATSLNTINVGDRVMENQMLVGQMGHFEASGGAEVMGYNDYGATNNSFTLNNFNHSEFGLEPFPDFPLDEDIAGLFSADYEPENQWDGQ